MTSYANALLIIPTGPGDTLYFYSEHDEWIYKHKFLWAVGKLDAAAAGEIFDVSCGHEAFMEKVYDAYEESLNELIGGVYIH